MKGEIIQKLPIAFRRIGRLYQQAIQPLCSPKPCSVGLIHIPYVGFCILKNLQPVDDIYLDCIRDIKTLKPWCIVLSRMSLSLSIFHFVEPITKKKLMSLLAVMFQDVTHACNRCQRPRKIHLQFIGSYVQDLTSQIC